MDLWKNSLATGGCCCCWLSWDNGCWEWQPLGMAAPGNSGPESDCQRFHDQLVYGHFVYDTSSTDISSTDISSTTVYQRVAQLYIQLLFQQIISFINPTSTYLHYDSFLPIPLTLTL